MSSFWSEALARKLNNSADDFPRVHTDKILRIQSKSEVA